MLPEVGHFLLVLAAVTSLFSAPVVFTGIARKKPFYRDFWRPALTVTIVSLVASIAILSYAFMTDDFSVDYVADNSNTHLMTAYKFAALWSGHEGSMMLFTALTALGAGVLASLLKKEAVLAAWSEGYMLLITAGFSFFLLLTSNPFLRNLPNVPVEGRDLNPVLQDIGMIVHPPVLFTGYAGLALMFALVCGLLSMKRMFKNDTALLAVEKLSLWTWAFLTAGNMLGSWWAYNELGWGGWWFWDPVENASFIPWLTTGALLHALIVLKHRAQLQRLSIFLGLTGFALVLFGTFVVRSGVMQSVHAFASDPARGTALLTLMLVILIPAALLYTARLPSLRTAWDKPLTNDDILLIGGVFLLSASAFCVFFGSVYPLIYEGLVGRMLTVGAPYFNSFFVPMTILAALGIALTQTGVENGKKALLSAGLAAILAGGIVGYAKPLDYTTAFGALFAGFWILTSAAIGRRLSKIALLAHIGVAVSIFGATGVGQYEQEALVRMGPGQGRPLGDVVFVYRETLPVEKPSYYGVAAYIEVLDLKTEDVVTVLMPERQTFRANGMRMSAAGIDHGLMKDYYVSMGNQLSDEEWLVRLTIKPLASWIWGGGCLMILAAFAALFKRRQKAIEKEKEFA